MVGLIVLLSFGRRGVTAALGADIGEVPTAFVALTVNVYAVPLYRFDTRQVSGPDVPILTHLVSFPARPGLAVTVYFVIALPPFDAEATHVTSTTPSPATAVTVRGALGTLDAPPTDLPALVNETEVRPAFDPVTTTVIVAPASAPPTT